MKKISKIKLEKISGGNCFFTGLLLAPSLAFWTVSPLNAVRTALDAVKCWNS